MNSQKPRMISAKPSVATARTIGSLLAKPRRDEAPVEQRKRRRSRDGGDPPEPMRTAGIRNLPRDHRAQRAQRALRQIEDSGSPIKHNKPNTGEDINRAGAEARNDKRTEVGH